MKADVFLIEVEGGNPKYRGADHPFAANRKIEIFAEKGT